MSSLVLWTTRCHAAGRLQGQPLPGVAALLSMVVVLSGATACRSVAVHPGDENTSANGTLSGTARGPGGVDPAQGRQVEATEVDTGRRYTTETNVAGGYSLMLPAGRYRLELQLEPGESLLEKPGVVTVEPSKLTDEQNFILAGAGVVQED
jgi:hypothetical protein